MHWPSSRSFTLLLAAVVFVSEIGPVARAADAPPAAAAKPAAAAADYGETTPSDVQASLEEAMQAKIKSLIDEKNGEGIPFKRGTFSRRFRRVDDSTYHVTMHRDTVKDDDSMMTERFLVTLKKDAATQKWKVTSEDLQDSYSNLYRLVSSKGEFRKFDSFSLSREGLSVSSGPGNLYAAYRNGKMERIVLTASDFKYEYAPPTPKFQALYEKLKNDHRSDLVFKPSVVRIDCDPKTCDDILATAFKNTGDSSADKADSKLRGDFDESVKNFKKTRRDSPFAGFDRPVPADRTVYAILVAEGSADWGSGKPDRRVGLAFDSYEPHEASFLAYSLDKRYPYWGPPIYSYYSAATIAGGKNPYDLERRDDPNGRDCDLVGLDGTVEMGLQDAEFLKADVTFKLKTKRELRELPFEISRDGEREDEKKATKSPQMVVNSIEDGDGNALTWVKLGQASGLVILPKTVPEGTPITVHMNFTNTASIYNFTSTFSQVDRLGWLPFVRFTDMISDFRLVVKVPARKKVLGIGKKVSDRVEGDVRVTEWIADSPVEFPSVTYGEYTEMDSKVEAKKSDGTKIPVRIHVDKGGIPIFDGIRVRDILQMSPSGIQFLADQAANSLNLYREIFGVDYPYGKLDLVNDPSPFSPLFYGQSPSSLIYLGEATFASQGTAGDMGGGNLSKFNRQVVPHEVAHQWWGSLIPNHNDGNYWFVESLAEYSSALYVESDEGKDAYQEKVADWRRDILDSDLQASVQDASTMWSGNLGGAYQAAVYAQGPYAFHVMRKTWGDEKFFKFLKTLTQKLKNKDIVTRDIQKVAEEVFGGNMDFFFDQWLRGVGHPEYTFNYSVRQTEDQKFLLEGTVDQRVLIGTKKDVLEGTYFTAIVPITIIGKSGKEYRIPLRIQGAKTTFTQKLPEAPKDVTLNKYGESLAYDVIVNKIAVN